MKRTIFILVFFALFNANTYSQTDVDTIYPYNYFYDNYDYWNNSPSFCYISTCSPYYPKVLNNERLLAENLTHHIHQEDSIEDFGLHNINKLSSDND